MRMIWRGLAGLSALCAVIIVAMSCVGGGGESDSAGIRADGDDRPPGEYNQSVGRMPALPEGVSNELWQQLNSELEKQLSAVKVTSTPPLRPLSQTALSENGTDLLWGYYSNGDYDQNGEVNTADLAPIAIHFKESAFPFKFPPNSVQAVIDGDDNGEINIADVTPIAVNFQNTVAKYNVYRSQNIADYPTDPSGDNGDATLIASVNLSDAFGAPNETRLQFDRVLPETLTEEYIWVRPEDNFEVEGIASNRLGPLSTTFTLDGHVFMAGGGSDPLPGVPIALSGDATAQTVTDINGHYSFDGLLSGDYTVTPSGDPYGYAPEFIATAIDSADKYLSPIYPAPVDIIRRWTPETAYGAGADDLVLDDEGNVYLAVQAQVEDIGTFTVLKYDMFGNLLWHSTKVFGLSISASNILLDPQGNIYLAGQYTTAPDEGLNRNYDDAFVLKLDSSGAEQWFFSYSSPTPPATIVNQNHSDGFSCLAFDPEGNLLGWSVANGMPESPFFYLRISPGGELLEEQYLDTEGFDYARFRIHDVQIDSLGNLYSGGYLSNIGEGSNYLMKQDPDGNMLWNKGWSNEYYGGAVAELIFGTDGSIFAVSVIEHGINLQRDINLAKLTPDGEASWEVQATADFMLHVPSLTLGPMGKLWVLSEQFSQGEGSDNHNSPFLMSFSQDGDLRFAKRWFVDSVGNKTHISSIEVNNYGVCVIAGGVDEQDGVWETPEFTLTRPEHEQFSQELVPYEAEGIVGTATVTDMDVTGVEFNQGYDTTLLMYYRP